MKLLFDLRATQPDGGTVRHGGGIYGEVIFFRMAELGIKFSCFYDPTLWLSPDVKNIIDKYDIPLYVGRNCKELQSLVDKFKFDRVFSCRPCMPFNLLPLLHDCETIGTIHDLRPMELAYDKCFWNYKSSLIEKFKFISKATCNNLYIRYQKNKYKSWFKNPKFSFITVSNHSHNELKLFFPQETKSRKIAVFYSPILDINLDSNTTTGTMSLNSEKYFLAVSGNRWEKNNARAIKAFDRLVDNGLIEGVRFKVTGAKRNNFRFKIKHEEAFDFLGYVSEEELEQLYAGAYLFVYPSLNEGFGYPPIEAMRYKVPVIASPLSSMAEILDQGALYFNPFLVEEIMNRMLMMMEPERHREFSERGYRQYLKISERQRKDLDGVIEYIIN